LRALLEGLADLLVAFGKNYANVRATAHRAGAGTLHAMLSGLERTSAKISFRDEQK